MPDKTSVDRQARSDGDNRRRNQVTTLVDIVVGLAVFIILWQVVFWIQIRPSYLLPSPTMAAIRLAQMALDGTMLAAIGITLERLLGGFALSITLGIGMGLVMVTFRRFGRMMGSFSVGLQAFPSIAWVPFAILLVGLNDASIVFVVVISSVFSVMVSTYGGFRNIPPIYLRAARNMGSHGFSLFWDVMLPASLLSLIIGIRQAWSFAWHAVIGAEILISGVAIGLGGILNFGAEFARMDQIIAAMVVIFLIGLTIDRLAFSRLEEAVRVRRGLNLPIS